MASKAAVAAGARYAARTAEIRRIMDPSTRNFAKAMSEACAEYEDAMRAAAASGDQEARVALTDGPRLLESM